MDVKRHAAFTISYGGVLVRANIVEQLGAGVGSALGCLALLGSNRV